MLDNSNNSLQQPMAGSAEPQHEMATMKKHGHIAQSRSVQKSHALPRRRSSSRPRSRPKSRGETRSSSRGRMDSSPPGGVSDEANNNDAALKRSGSLNRFSSWSMIRDGKIDEQGRCRRHPNIELYRREATNSNESWRMLLQDCPLCSLHDSGLNCNSDYREMMMIRKDSMTLMSGEATAQTTMSSGEETSVDSSDASNNNDNVSKREKMSGPSPSNIRQTQVPPPPRKQSSVQTLKALGKMHMDGDDAASISAKSISSRRSSRHPPPPPPAGRNPFSISGLNPSTPSKKGSNSSMSSLSTKELSRLRKERHSSESINERIAQLRGEQQHSQRKEGEHHDLGRSLERFRAERKAAKDELKERLNKSGRSRKQKQKERLDDKSSETFTIPLNDDVRGRGRAPVARGDDEDILGAAADIRSRARRSLSRSRDRKASVDMFGSTPSVSGDDRTVDGGDTMSVSSRGRRSITNPHGLAEPPRPLQVQRRSQSRERRSRSRGGTVDGGGSERQSYNGKNERASEVLINRRREMRQRLSEQQTAADYRRASCAVGDIDHQSVRDEGFEDRTRETRRSAKSAERGERGRGRSRSRVRDGISKIRSASLKAFRKKDQKKSDKEEQRMSSTRSLVSQGSRIRSRTLELEEQTVDSGRMSFRSLVSHGSSRLRSRSRGRRVKSQREFDNENFSHLSPTTGRSGAFEV